VSRGLLLVLALALLVPGRAFFLARQLLAPLPGGGDHLLADACVRSVPAWEGGSWQFDAQVGFPQYPAHPARTLRMRLPVAAAGPAVGECWQYAARPSQPRDVAGRRALLRDHLAGYARIDPGGVNRRISTGAHGVTGLRAGLARRIADQVADPSAAALLVALAVGATGEVTTRQWQVFNATGITHLVAISGMHVTFFALLAMGAARALWRRLAPRPWLPRRSAFAATVGCALALLYALLAGFSVPAQRTVVMLVVILVMRECARSVSSIRIIGVALAAVLLYDPLAWLGAGFWLSFVAVAAIVLLAGARLQQPAPLAGALALQWMVSVALLPFTVALFGSFAAAGLLVNLLAIPVFTLLLVPLVLIATACYLLPGVAAGWCGDALLQLAGAVATLLWPALCWCADLPGALWYAAPPWSWYLLAVPVALLALLPVARRLRLVALLLLGSVFLLRAPRPAIGEMWIDARGQGAAATVLLRTHAHLLLLGTGETWGSAGRRFAQQLLPALRATGYPHMDLWLPGRLTRDAQAALRAAATELPTGMAMLPPAYAPPPELQPCRAMRWRWDGIDFELRVGDDGRDCVLVASSGAHAVVFGDAAVAHLLKPADGSAQLRLDAAGLALRSTLLRL
jgi:competence protein ComEC